MCSSDLDEFSDSPIERVKSIFEFVRDNFEAYTSNKEALSIMNINTVQESLSHLFPSVTDADKICLINETFGYKLKADVEQVRREADRVAQLSLPQTFLEVPVQVRGAELFDPACPHHTENLDCDYLVLKSKEMNHYFNLLAHMSHEERLNY